MKRIAQLFVSVFILFAFADSAQAGNMRCGRALISRGDHQGEVISACGDPVIASQRTIYRTGVPRRRLSVFGFGDNTYSTVSDRELLYHNRSVVEVPVDVWTYNFGPRKFMREVTFIEGRVAFIKTLGYGH